MCGDILNDTLHFGFDVLSLGVLIFERLLSAL